MNFNHLKHKTFLVLIAFSLSAFLDGNVIAQSGTTSVSGTVFDQQGKNILGAAVTLTSAEKGFTRIATTNEDGIFAFPAIQPGVYRLEIETNGFKKFVQTEVPAVVDSPTEISVFLEVGSVSEIVTVKSNTAESLLNKQD